MVADRERGTINITDHDSFEIDLNMQRPGASFRNGYNFSVNLSSFKVDSCVIHADQVSMHHCDIGDA